MNKNYSNMLMITMLSLTAHSGLMSSEQAKKSCIDPKKHTLKLLAADYIMANFALYGATTTASAGFITALGSAPLRNSMNQLIKTSWDVSKKIKTPLIAAPLAVGYNAVKKHSVK